MIPQNKDGIDEDAQHYSCLFNVLCSSRKAPWDVSQYNEAWRGARLAGCLSGDLNGDGDYDDPGEDEITSYQKLIEYLGLPLRAVSPESLNLPMIKIDGIWRIAPLRSPLDTEDYLVAEAWKWKIRHFVLGDGTGSKKPIWDPIQPESLTRRNGFLESLRVFKRIHS